MPRGGSGSNVVKGLNTTGSKNTFRFQKLSQRVKRARIAARAAPRGHDLYAVGDAARPSEVVGDFDAKAGSGTFFRDALEHWSDRNLTAEFVAFQRQVFNKVQTLPQLLHHLGEIVSTIIEHLSSESRQASEPLLSLTATLAQDVGADLLPHLERIVRCILAKVDSSDPEFMGANFKALSLLFKHLSKHLLTDLESVCSWFSPLLTHPKSFIREFMAESLAFLLRKLKGKQLRKHVRGLILSIDAQEASNDAIEGVSVLLFEMVKNVQNQFHSQTDSVVRAMLECLTKADTSGIQEPLESCRQLIVRRGLFLMMEHTRAKYATVIWDELFRASQKFEKIGVSIGEDAAIGLCRIIYSTAQCAEHRHGTRILRDGIYTSKMYKLIAYALKVCKALARAGAECCEVLYKSILQLMRGAWIVASHFASPGLEQRIRNFHLEATNVLRNCSQSGSRLQDACAKALTLHLRSLNAVVGSRPVILGTLACVIIECCNEILAKLSPESTFSLLLSVHKTITDNQTDGSQASLSRIVTAHNKLRVSHLSSNNRPTAAAVVESILDILNSSIDEVLKHGRVSNASVLWYALRCARVLHDPSDSIIPSVDRIAAVFISATNSKVSTINKKVDEKGGIMDENIFLCAETIRTQLTLKPFNQKTLHMKRVEEYLQWVLQPSCRTNVAALSAFSEFVGSSVLRESEYTLRGENAIFVINILQPGLQSGSHLVRLHCLKIMAACEPLNYRQKLDSRSKREKESMTQLTGPCTVIQMLLRIEELELSLEFERERESILRRVETLLMSGVYPTEYLPLTASYLFGIFSIKFSRSWSTVKDVLVTLAKCGFSHVWRSALLQIHPVTGIPLGTGREGSSTSSLDNRSESGRRRVSFDELDNAVKAAKHGVLLKTDSQFKRGMSRIKFETTVWEDVEEQTWNVLIDCANQMEQHMDYLSYLFVLFLKFEYYTRSDRIATSFQLDDCDNAIKKLSAVSSIFDDQTVAKDEIINKLQHRQRTSRSATKLVLQYFKLFSQFKKLKRARVSKELYSIFEDFLSNSDDSISSEALRCIYRYDLPRHQGVKETLGKLTKDSDYRNTMLTWNVRNHLDEMGSSEARLALGSDICYIAIGKLMHRKGRSAKSDLHTKRSVVLGFLSSLKGMELESLFLLLTREFTVSRVRNWSDFEVNLAHGVRPAVQLGFVNLFHELALQLSFKVIPFLDKCLSLIMELLKFNSNQTKITDQNSSDGTPLDVRKVRSTSFKVFAFVFSKFKDFTFSRELFVLPLQKLIVRESKAMPSSLAKSESPSAMMELICTITQNSKVRTSFFSNGGQKIIPCMFQCISSLGDSVVDVALKFVEGLIEHDEINQETENQTEVSLLQQNLDVLMLEFKKRLTSRSELLKDRTNKRVVFNMDQHVLSILSRVSLFATKCNQTNNRRRKVIAGDVCQQLVSLLLPYLRETRRLSGGAKKNVLDTVCALTPFVEDMTSHVTFLSMMLLPGKNSVDGEVRLALIDLLVAMSKNDSVKWLRDPVNFVLELNSWNPKRIDQIDYDRRLKACHDFENSFKVMECFPQRKVQLVLYQLIHTLNEDDYALRKSALDTVSSIVKFVSENVEVVEKSSIKKTNSVYGGNVGMLATVLMPAIKSGMKSQNSAIRKTFVLLLTELSSAFENQPIDKFPLLHLDIRYLINKTDVEADILQGLIHLQMHRRAKALRRFRANHSDVGAVKILQPSTLSHIFLPLVTHILYETEKASDYIIVDEAITTISSISRHLPWSRYYSVIRLLFAQLQRRSDKEKVFIKAICACIDAFHFHCPGPKPNAIENDESVNLSDDDNEAPNIKQPLSTVTNTLLNKLMPQLYQYLIKGSEKKDSYADDSVSNNGAELRVPIALGIVKILKHLPKALIIGELERLLSRICALLAYRDQAVRDTTRKTLVRITQELGPDYVKTVLKQLKITLHSGFMVHVLSYSLHAVISGTLDNLTETNYDNASDTHKKSGESSTIDLLIPEVIQVLDDDIFGRVAQQRNSENYRPRSQLSEARTCKSYDTFEILAKHLTFLPCLSVHMLVSPIVSKLDDSQNLEDAGSIDGIVRAPTVVVPAKVEKACRDVLSRISNGLAKNLTVKAKPMMIYIHSLLSKYLPKSVHRSNQNDEILTSDGPGSTSSLATSSNNTDDSKKRKRPTSRPIDTHIIPEAPRLTGYDQHITHMVRGVVFNHIWVEYALSLLHNIFKKKIVNRSLISHKQLLDPFCLILARCLRLSKENRVTVLALRCLCSLLSWEDLPTLSASLPTIIDQTFRLLRIASTGMKGKEMKHVGFQVITNILHSQKKYKFNNTRFRALIGLIRANMEDMHSQNTSFSLIKAILSRQVLVPELYDLMQHCSNLIVTSHRPGVQKLCGQVFFKFMVEYPLAQKRRQQHLDDLIANLKYEYEGGRLAVIGLLRNIVNNWPAKALNEQAKNFFLHFTLRVANETSTPCRIAIFQTLEVFLKEVEQNEYKLLIDFLLQWMHPRDNFSDQTNRMTCASLQTICIAVQAQAAFFRGSVAEELASQCFAHITREAQCVESVDTLNIVESDSGILTPGIGLNNWCPNGCSWEPSFFALSTLESCLKSDVILNCTSPFFQDVTTMLLHRHHLIRVAACRFLGQYFAHSQNNKNLDKDVIVLILRKLCRVLEGSYLDKMIVDAVVRNLCFLSKLLCELSESSNSQRTPIVDCKKRNVGPDFEDELKPLNWIFHRMSFLARKKRLDHEATRFELRATAVLQWMALMLQIDGVGSTYASVILAPVFRLVNSNARECSNDLRSVAQELMEMLQGKISKELFMTVHETTRARVTEEKAERKRMRAQERIRDPKAAALFKQRRNEAKKRNREKRKTKSYGKRRTKRQRMKNNSDIL